MWIYGNFSCAQIARNIQKYTNAKYPKSNTRRNI